MLRSWGCAPGWYEAAPSALDTWEFRNITWFTEQENAEMSAKGAFHISLGRSPRISSQRARGLKARFHREF